MTDFRYDLPDEMAIRIVFRSGIVREERGTEELIEQLLDQDEIELNLIDYVLALDLRSGEVTLWQDDDDERFEDYDPS